MIAANPIAGVFHPVNRIRVITGLLAIVFGVSLWVLPPTTLLVGAVIASVICLSLMSPLAGLVFLLVIGPLAVLGETEAPQLFRVDVDQLLFAWLIFSWFAHRAVMDRRLPSLRFSPILVLMVVWVAVLGLTALVSISFSAWLREWLKWAEALILIIFVMDMAETDGWQSVVVALLAAAFANAVVGLYEFFGGSGALHLLVNGRYFRAFGTMGQPNPFGGFMGLAAPLGVVTTLALLWHSLHAFLHSKRVAFAPLLLGVLTGIVTLVIMAAVIASWSRGAWLAFFASTGLTIVLFPRRGWHSLSILLAGTLLVGGAWLGGALPQSITDRLSTINRDFQSEIDVRGANISNDNYAVIERLAHWQAAIRMAEANPLLGVGAGHYELVYPQYRLINWDEPLGHAHNYYLNILAEAGLIGLFGYLFLWVGVIMCSLQCLKHPDLAMRSLAVGLLGTWSYLLIHSLTDNLYVNGLFLHIGVMLGLLAVIYQQRTTGVILE